MIAIINYGIGNIQSFANLYRINNIEYKIANNLKDLENIEKIILPGVGSFDWAMQKLNESGMRDRIDELVLIEKKKVLGVCVGMQMMASGSEEGELDGLNWIEGFVKKIHFKEESKNLFLPHMGWNNVNPVRNNHLIPLTQEWNFYFLHSYYFNTVNVDNILSTTEYNEVFPSAVINDNIFGVQFHPEKSHNWGRDLLMNFAKL
jgi:glutamine amidotransferase